MDLATVQAPWVRGNSAEFGREDSNSVEYSPGPKIPGTLTFTSEIRLMIYLHLEAY